MYNYFRLGEPWELELGCNKDIFELLSTLCWSETEAPVKWVAALFVESCVAVDDETTMAVVFIGVILEFVSCCCCCCCCSCSPDSTRTKRLLARLFSMSVNSSTETTKNIQIMSNTFNTLQFLLDQKQNTNCRWSKTAKKFQQ